METVTFNSNLGYKLRKTETKNPDFVLLSQVKNLNSCFFSMCRPVFFKVIFPLLFTLAALLFFFASPLSHNGKQSLTDGISKLYNTRPVTEKGPPLMEAKNSSTIIVFLCK